MAKVPKYNAVQRSVLSSRNSLIMREASLDAQVEKLLKPMTDEWERTIRSTLSRRAKDLTPTELAQVLRRTGSLNQLRAVSAQYVKSVERAVGQVVRETFRSEAYRAAHAASLGPEPGRIGVGFGGVNRAAVAAAARSPILTAKIARDLSGLTAATVTGLRRDLTRAVADGWNLSDLADKWAEGAGAGRAIVQAQTIARTAMMAASNQGQVFQWREEGVYKQLRWEATFDARTCPACGSRHGKVYEIDNLPPLPFHWGCRCVWLPVFAADSERALKNLSPYKGGGPGAAAGRTRSYEAWLNKQPAGIQMDVLGSEVKYKAWRDGDLTLAQLTNPDATTLTDAQVNRALGRAAAPPPITTEPISVPAPMRKPVETDREVAEALSGPKLPGAYDGPTIGEGIRANMAKELRASLETAQVREAAVVQSEMEAAAAQMDSIYGQAKAAGRQLTHVEHAELTSLGDKIDHLVRERTVAWGDMPSDIQAKLHKFTIQPGASANGLAITAEVTAVPGEVVLPDLVKRQKERVETAIGLIRRRVADRPFNTLAGQKDGIVGVRVHSLNYRANYSYEDRLMRIGEETSVRTIVHEFGHHLEASNPGVEQAARRFLARRTAGEAYKKLAELEPGLGYTADEMAMPDKFISPYVGKYYRNATEVVSMGLEYYIEAPWVLAKRDPEMFDFIAAIARGNYAEMHLIADGAAGAGFKAAKLAAPEGLAAISREAASAPVEKPSTLLTGAVKKSKAISSGVNQTFKVTLEDGTEVIYKPLSGENKATMMAYTTPGRAHLHEAAASLFDREFAFGDLVPETVARNSVDGIEGSFQVWVKNAKTVTEIQVTRPMTAEGVLTEPQRKRLALFDMVIGNFDRHGGNAMLDKAGKLHAIDNGSAFPINSKIKKTRRFKLADPTAVGPGLPQDFEGFLTALTEDESRVHEVMGKLLNKAEIDSMLQRARWLLESPEKWDSFLNDPYAFAKFIASKVAG